MYSPWEWDPVAAHNFSHIPLARIKSCDNPDCKGAWEMSSF